MDRTSENIDGVMGWMLAAHQQDHRKGCGCSAEWEASPDMSGVVFWVGKAWRASRLRVSAELMQDADRQELLRMLDQENVSERLRRVPTRPCAWFGPWRR